MDYRQEIKDIALSKFECCDASQLVEWLFEGGLIPDNRARDYVIKAEYVTRIRQQKDSGESCTEIKYQLAADYELPYPTIKNIIYSTPHVSP